MNVSISTGCVCVSVSVCVSICLSVSLFLRTYSVYSDSGATLNKMNVFLVWEDVLIHKGHSRFQPAAFYLSVLVLTPVGPGIQFQTY